MVILMFSHHSFVDSLFQDDIKNVTKNFDPNLFFYDLLEEIPEEENLLNRMLYMEINSFLSDHNLNYTDKMGMAVGVEIRVPFLDKKLVELSAQVPPQLKMKGTTTKYILKKIAERYLPKDVIYRPKTGFGAPIDRWIKNELKPMINTRLDSELLISQGIFNPSAIKKIIQENDNNKIRGSYPIWSLLSVQSWLNQFENHK
jgi:asparagine synthase (glutamine-hydrolysing)